MLFKDEQTGFWNYTKQPDDQIIGILFGHFCPFTGPKGHGRLLDALKKIGAAKFIVGMPDGGEKLDTERYMFNTLQRKEIIETALQEKGLDGEVVLCKTYGGPKKVFNYLTNVASKLYGPKIRPVFCFGPDRESDFADFFVPFNTQLDSWKYEVLIQKDRGEHETSGTLVREFIKKGDVDVIKELTGYSESICNQLVNLWQKNVKILERGSKEVKAMAGKHHLEHLFNDNKPSQMKPAKFIQVMEFVKSTGSSFNSSNFEVSEKIDGSSSFIGFDSCGFYFSKFGVSIKMRRSNDVGILYREFFELLKKSGVEELLEKWREKEDCEDIKVQLENVLPSASKDSNSVQTVLVKYDKSKIGNGLVITIQALADITPITDDSLKEEVCKLLQGVGLQAKTSTNLEIKEIPCKDIIDALTPIFENPKLIRSSEEEIQSLQQVLQERILDTYTEGNFGKDYEGLVFTSLDGKIQFKVTSEKFKQLMALHNKPRSII